MIFNDRKLERKIRMLESDMKSTFEFHAAHIREMKRKMDRETRKLDERTMPLFTRFVKWLNTRIT